MNKKEAADYVRKWREVERLRDQELRQTPLHVRFAQMLAACRMAEGLRLAHHERDVAAEQAVIARWRLLREALRSTGDR